MSKSIPTRDSKEQHSEERIQELLDADEEINMNNEELNFRIETAMITFRSNIHKTINEYSLFREENQNRVPILQDQVPSMENMDMIDESVTLFSIFPPYEYFFLDDSDFRTYMMSLFQEIVPFLRRIRDIDTEDDRGYVVGALVNFIKLFPDQLAIQFGEQALQLYPEGIDVVGAVIMLAVRNIDSLVNEGYIVDNDAMISAEQYVMHLFESIGGIFNFSSCVLYYYQLIIKYQRGINVFLNNVEVIRPELDIDISGVQTENNIDWERWVRERR